MNCTYEELREICGDLTHKEFKMLYDVPDKVIAEWKKNGVPEYMYHLIGELHYNRVILNDYIEKYEPWRVS